MHRSLKALTLLNAISAIAARDALFNPGETGPDNSVAHKDLSLEVIVPKAKRNRAQWKREQKIKRK